MLPGRPAPEVRLERAMQAGQEEHERLVEQVEARQADEAQAAAALKRATEVRDDLAAKASTAEQAAEEAAGRGDGPRASEGTAAAASFSAQLEAVDRDVATVTGALETATEARTEAAAAIEAHEGLLRDQPGVGPHPHPWPEDPRLDPELLASGDRRNVVDRYRYWTVDAIVADLDERRHPYHVAVENWASDMNIGTVVRNANAFGAGTVTIVGRRRWNRRGAMVTDRYQHVAHLPDVAALVTWAEGESLTLVGIDNLPGAVPLEETALPRRCVLLFGQEGDGLSEEARAACDVVCSIAQVGSTRSINAGVASGIAMHTWLRQHAL